MIPRSWVISQHGQTEPCYTQRQLQPCSCTCLYDVAAAGAAIVYYTASVLLVRCGTGKMAELPNQIWQSYSIRKMQQALIFYLVLRYCRHLNALDAQLYDRGLRLLQQNRQLFKSQRRLQKLNKPKASSRKSDSTRTGEVYRDHQHLFCSLDFHQCIIRYMPHDPLMWCHYVVSSLCQPLNGSR